MPRGDRTGPNGAGPLTGRGLGDCAGTVDANYAVGRGIGFGGAFRRGGRGLGRGFGRGLGRGLGFYQGTAVTNTELLKQEKEYLQNRLNQIDKDLETL